MSTSIAVWLVLLLAAVLANLPFINERLFAVGPDRSPKGIATRLLELLLYTALTIGFGRWIEGRNSQITEQGWPFYAVLSCVMLTLAFPGFVWRHLRRQH
jgi:GNAT superfamily N-acetyltransferase